MELKDRAFLFQSTLPARGATLELLKTAVYQSFQSTLPARGATRGREANTKAMLISIHAPRTGSDLTPRNWNAHQKNFNPRSPHGERRLFVGFAAEDSFISIHAPRTGSDAAVFPAPASPSRFQSTLPARGATLLEGNPGKQKLFQSTLPARGATLAADVEGFANLISIHAPRTGSDVFADAHGRITAHFNPRSPHGERHGVLGYSPIAFEFQSTLPARGATAASTVSTSVTRTFQSTLPARGATGGIQHFVTAIAISIHAPRTGSDPSRQWSLARPDISIHAPRTGSDGRAGAYGADAADFNPRSPHGERRLLSYTHRKVTFQSTLPARGATRCTFPESRSPGISTHAPRTGSDGLRGQALT